MKQAKVRLIKGDFSWLWINDECPVCGRKHTYGGGAKGVLPVTGVRTAKCPVENLEPATDEKVELVPENSLLAEVLSK